MSKKIKAMELEALRKSFGGVKNFVIVEPLKVDAGTDYEFRKKLREKKIFAQMVKNSYAKKIFGEMGIKVESVWSGPTVLCWGAANPKELSNTVESLVKELRKDPKLPEKFKIKTGVAEGESISIEAMKTLPTREEAIASVLSAVLAPGAALAGCLIGPATQLAGILKAIEEKKDEAVPEAPAPAAG